MSASRVFPVQGVSLLLIGEHVAVSVRLSNGGRQLLNRLIYLLSLSPERVGQRPLASGFRLGKSSAVFRLQTLCLLRSVKFLIMLKAPVHDCIENREQILSHFCKTVLHMGRDLVELLSGYQAVVFQLTQALGQHGVGNARQVLFELTKRRLSGGTPTG